MPDAIPDTPLFQGFTPAQISLLKPLFEPFTCPPDTVIFEQDEPASYLYYLTKGKIAIRYKPYDGPPITLTHLRDGDVFGWSAVVGSTHYTSSIVSETPIKALRARGSHLSALVREHPEIGPIFMDRLASIVSSRWQNARAQVQSFLGNG